MSWSLRRRLTATVVGLVASVLVALAIVLYLAVRSATWQQRDDSLEARARALATSAEHDDAGYEMLLPPEPANMPPTYIEVWKSDGSVLVRSPSLHGGAIGRTFARAGGAAFADVTLPDGRDGRAIALQFLARDESSPRAPPLLLVVEEGTESIDAVVATVRTWFLLAGLAALGAIGAVTAWSLARGLRPLSQLATKIEQIDERQLGTRFVVDDPPVELGVLVRKLDELLARLDQSFSRERQFTADVSHELRTPLAGLRTLLEVTALRDRSTAEYRDVLADALAIVEQLGAVVENLLTLARLDAGQVAIENCEVGLRELVDDAWRPYASQARARSIEFRNAVPPSASVQTDREKLRIVVGNLLSNAAAYTDAGGWIEVTTRRDCLLDVVDSGPAIPSEQLESIFDRMWRGDTARAATGVHCGIGLSLSRALCDCLALDLAVVSLANGTVSFQISSVGERGSREGAWRG
ncbi:MAG: histidine kinase dimerization/phospho-acceptor domain-containing protein [Kofleriaceae bacterium]